MDPEKLRKEAQIYQLKPDDKLLNYHKAINEAAFAAAKEDPSLLCSKNVLQKQARLRLHNSGFVYKKKGTRSKQLGNVSNVGNACKPTREKISQEMRQKRVAQLHEDMREVDIQLSFALKQRAKCANVSNFSKALDVSKEMDDLRKKKRKYQEELTLLQRKEALSNRVKKCMSRRTKTPAPAKGNLDQFLCKKSASSEQAKASDSASISHEDVTEISQFNTSHDDTVAKANIHVIQTTKKL